MYIYIYISGPDAGTNMCICTCIYYISMDMSMDISMAWIMTFAWIGVESFCLVTNFCLVTHFCQVTNLCLDARIHANPKSSQADLSRQPGRIL